MRWLKVLAVFASVVMVGNCLAAQTNPHIPLVEVAPCTAMTLAVTHLALRGPYRRLTWLEFPLVVLSLLLAFVGAFHFRPDGKEEDPAFQAFFAVFISLAWLFTLACTASAADTEWRRQVIQPTRKMLHFGVPGLDLGLVFAPLVFPFLALLFLLRRGSPR